jgi:hypothetical protein
MPPVIAAVAGVLISLGDTVGIAITASLATTIATSLVMTGITLGVNLLVSAIGNVLGGGIKRSPGMIVSTRDPNAPWRIVYGRSRIAGVVTFICTTGANNEYLHIVLTLCKGKIHAIQTMYFDGTAIPLQGGGNGQGVWTGLVHAEFSLGDPTDSSQPFPGLASAAPGYWNNTSCLQQGHAKAYVQLKWNATRFPSGIPNITFDVEGREVYDPRTSTTAYSENPALCMRDYLTDQTLGLMVDASTEIDDASVIAAANICDATVTLKGQIATAVVSAGHAGSGYAAGNLVGVSGGNADAALWVAQTDASGHVQRVNVSNPGSGYTNATVVSATGGAGTGLAVDITTNSGTEPTYNCNGAFESTEAPGSVLNYLALSMAGFMTCVNGKFCIYAGAWPGVSGTITDDDLRGPLEVQTRISRRDIFNSIHGLYRSPANNWTESDFPPIVNSGYVTQDGGALLWQLLNLPFTISGSMAQRIANIVLERNRRQVQLTLHCKLGAAQYQPSNIIQLTHSRYGWTNKTFRVRDVSLVIDKDIGDDPAIGVDLYLIEDDSSTYTWTTAQESALPQPATATAPDSTTVQPVTGLTASSDITTAAFGSDGTINNRIKLTWTAPADQFVQSGGKIVVQYKKSSDTTWLPAIICDGAATQIFTGTLAGGVAYDLQVWCENTTGAISSASSVLNFSASNLIAACWNPGFKYTSSTSTITWYWDGTNGSTIITIYRADGTSFTVSGSQAVTGLSPSTTYYFYPYYDLASSTLKWVTGGSGSPAIAQAAPSPALAQAQGLNGQVPVSTTAMAASTTASGSGGGSAGGRGTE